MTLAAEAKDKQTLEDARINALLKHSTQDITFEQLCFLSGVPYAETLAINSVAKQFIKCIENQATFLRGQLAAHNEAVAEAERNKKEQESLRLATERELEKLAERLSQVRKL